MKTNITYKSEKKDINWQEVSDILSDAGLSFHPAWEQCEIFTNSYAVVFAYDCDKIVGVGRAISDGVCQAAIYNIAVREEYKGAGIGTQIVGQLLDKLKGQNVILYTHPRSLKWYERLGFRRNKTALCIFEEFSDRIDHIESEGFLMPEKYRFKDETNRGY